MDSGSDTTTDNTTTIESIPLYTYDDQLLFDSLVEFPVFDYMTFPTANDEDEIYPDFPLITIIEA